MAFPPIKQAKLLSSHNLRSASSAAVAAIQAHMASISPNPAQPQPQAQVATPPPSHHATGDPTLDGANFDTSSSDQEYEEGPDTRSPIEISISVPLTVQGHSNNVHVDPSLSASKIAMAIVAALKQASMCEGGVPMIDEEGRPRPIKVHVRAETRVVGDDNIVGAPSGKQGAEETKTGKVAAKELSGMIVSRKEQGTKRERADSDLVEEAGIDEKRVRRE
ncbi:hypothetical protein B7494_g3332 [Chlorociboria aeruginascens]|nr:hypothetical protein B7494_g3332 [Chlorociboria aeruginascens]